MRRLTIECSRRLLRKGGRKPDLEAIRLRKTLVDHPLRHRTRDKNPHCSAELSKVAAVTLQQSFQSLTLTDSAGVQDVKCMGRVHEVPADRRKC